MNEQQKKKNQDEYWCLFTNSFSVSCYVSLVYLSNITSWYLVAVEMFFMETFLVINNSILDHLEEMMRNSSHSSYLENR